MTQLAATKPIVSVVVLLAMGLTAGCGESTIPQPEASEYVDAWSPTVEDTLREMAVAPAGKKTLKSRLSQAAASQQSKVQRDHPPYDIFVKHVYEPLDYDFKLVDRTGLTDRGQAVWKTLRAVDDHGLDPQAYAIADIKAELDKLDEANARFEKLGAFEPNKDERQTAVDWLTAQKPSAFDLAESNYSELTRTVLDSDSGGRLEERLADYKSVSQHMADLEAGVEQLLARNLARYSRKMKHFRIRHAFVHPKNFDRWTNPNIDGRRPDQAQARWHARSTWRQAAKIARSISKKNKTDILYGRIEHTLTDVLTGDAPAALAALTPNHPQYAALKDEYARYKKIVDQGGWDKVPKTAGLRPNRDNATVEALKRRLQIEGYYPADAPVDTTYGDVLEQAIKSYQTTHQMEVTGKPHRMFWSSLNMSATRRMKQIKLNMQRWRASNIRHSDPLYVYVNIPDFTTEVWKDQKRVMRFGIVVGNNGLAPKKKRLAARNNPDKDVKVHPNRTPQLSAYIDRVIYNPYWNVTDRIRHDEILPKVRKSVEAAYKAKIKRLVGSSAPTAANQTASTASSDEETLAGTLSPGPGAPSAAPGGHSTNASTRQTNSAGNAPGADSLAGRRADSQTSSAAKLRGLGASAGRSRRSAKSYWSTTDDGGVVFDVSALKGLVGAGSQTPSSTAGASADSKTAPTGMAAKFTYVNPANGRVDVSTTDPDHIPGWYEANNYEVMFPGKKWEYVRMKQGGKNALGQVKVIFPNLYDVYLHDTPHQALFKRDIRAFSHGCMRMHKPLEFAKYLLEQDGQLDEYDIDQILAQTTYKPIFFDKQIPVHIDYITVRVGDEGRAHFLADVYDYDTFGDDG